MDTEIQDNSTDNINNETSEASEITTQPSEETLSLADKESQIQVDETGEEKPPEAYEPNFKYNVLGIEKEFDERLRGLIKSKEDEEWLRDVMTRADGFENDKKSYKQLRQDHEKIASEYTQMNKDVNQVLEMRDKNDLDSLFQVLGIKPEAVQQWNMRRQQYGQLTPEQKAYYDRQQELQRSHYSLNQQNQELMNKINQIELQTRQSELTNKLSSSEHAPLIKEFDSRNGQNSFMAEVIRRGALYETQMGVEKTADELISEVASFLTFNQQPQNPSQAGAQAPKVIPNTGTSGGQAPVKKKPKTLDDLKRMMGEV